jgi:hypothetical protein
MRELACRCEKYTKSDNVFVAMEEIIRLASTKYLKEEMNNCLGAKVNIGHLKIMKTKDILSKMLVGSIKTDEETAEITDFLPGFKISIIRPYKIKDIENLTLEHLFVNDATINDITFVKV